MINGIEYIDYDKLSDDLCWLGNKCIVRMVVKLANKNKDNERQHFHREFKYPANYADKREAITVRRSFSYYISIDSLEDSQSSIMITINDILPLRAAINQVYNWFYDKTFALKGGNMIILEQKNPITVEGLIGGKYLKFEPIVYLDRYEKQSKGVRIMLGDTSFTDVPVDAFTGFLYLMNTIDMFNAAQNLINYMGHPDFGTNLVTYARSEYVGKEEPESKIKNRQIPNKRPNKSFFDLDDM